MSAVSTAPRTRKESRVQFALLDWKTITKRNLMTYVRKPDLLVFSTIQPVMFVLLFVYVFGGAIKKTLPRRLPTRRDEGRFILGIEHVDNDEPIAMLVILRRLRVYVWGGLQ